MYLKEYRICMPLSVEEYKIGQLYMIAKHSHEQSEHGEGVEVVKNEECDHPKHGKGRFTEKRVYLSSRLPSWIRSMIPNIFYITEKAWNYYPYTETVVVVHFMCVFSLQCSFVPLFKVYIETRYENNNGSSENCVGLSDEDIEVREVEHIDIAYDDIPEKNFKKEEDLKTFKSTKTDRGPLQKGWRDTSKPIMCSYKAVKVYFEMWGMQTKVEQFGQRSIKDILVLGHRQAFAWIDEWIDMSMEDLRKYESETNEKTNAKVLSQ
ncbi:Phosphatidylinositol transfer protein alpha isoform,Membrane-associated phosphatidylinositol transfer protein 2,Phosphatidylinositol transfer protein 1,Phosphatidylinositol transfer protein 2,Cytoplasmic phosphatidylinositol transfer protein 1,Protein retinal degeneration B,Phosphatidylinositol transfer protein 5,Phosphatidylinositol transfer protein beta isoform [Mytilus coruscus]|uniref:Phosphatidylinositol transfer protein N-terminal domain-containing protein n=1 Tax=Mytilus coruscus TaxID=42192 RepID=A0A6J8BQB6_MYTCO|nr:Phosphatidylinositol transfer protein alpha isoform,Membrane-associated phosphatidylinositol transfer protein 2,Phosphatidylinositol transfer protein 1,Phosphatidylinositol transfer protein 2,Cytoplasmic phosphatidylinositol transfer protein 1,Protein retinal degeneration B,Phosphatidylinositol transfer protein 5,Phosphatidylinositol transfer protein beta isoform [Mytilus coruscus]